MERRVYKMKITVNENESYEIEMPKELKIQQLPFLAERLFKISKILGKDILLDAINNKDKKEVKHKTYKISRKNLTKEMLIELFKIYYSENSKAEKVRLMKDKNIDNYYFSHQAWILRKKFEIMPQDIGVKKFPSGKGSRIKK
jgi:hypothetical protein